VIGELETSVHFVVPYDQADVSEAVDALWTPGSVLLLHGPRQAGKTSFGHHVCHRLKAQGRVVLRVSLEPLFERFHDEDAAALAFCSALYESAVCDGVIAADSATPTLSDASAWATRAFSTVTRHEKPVIVMIDEFDALLSAPGKQAVVDSFLHWLRGLATLDTWLGSLLLIGSNAALRVKSTSRPGVSPWNVANKFPMQRLNRDHLRGVLKEFTDERGCSEVPADVIDDIIATTGGHKGWCMLGGKCLDEALASARKHPPASATGRGSLDIGALWKRARVEFHSQLRGLESCVDMRNEMQRMPCVDAMRLLAVVASGRSRRAWSCRLAVPRLLRGQRGLATPCPKMTLVGSSSTGVSSMSYPAVCLCWVHRTWCRSPKRLRLMS
jgi:hypothetical protein